MCNDAPCGLFVVNTSSVCMIIIACTLRTYHCNVGFGGPLSTRPLYTPWGGPVGNANTTLCVHTGFWLLLIRCKKSEHQITKWQKYFLSFLSMRARNLSINKIIWWCSFLYIFLTCLKTQCAMRRHCAEDFLSRRSQTFWMINNNEECGKWYPRQPGTGTTLEHHAFLSSSAS